MPEVKRTSSFIQREGLKGFISLPTRTGKEKDYIAGETDSKQTS
jgi:hypothetical protein